MCVTTIHSLKTAVFGNYMFKGSTLQAYLALTFTEGM